MSSVKLSYSLSIGPDLVREHDVDIALTKYRPRETENVIYGALLITYRGDEALDERYWDRLDLLLSHLYVSIRDVSSNSPHRFEFEDSHVPCEVIAAEGDTIRVKIDETLEFIALRSQWLQELTDCSRRLTNTFERHHIPVPTPLQVIANSEDPS